MKATEIKIGRFYEVTAGRNKTKVKVVNFSAKNGSWECETEAGKTISVKDSQRFLKEIGKKKNTPETIKTTPKTQKNETIKTEQKTERNKGGKPKGKLSGLDAAHEILVSENRPMKVKEITGLAIERGLWAPEGKTPDATVSSAIQREIKARGEASRFAKVDKGLFAAK